MNKRFSLMISLLLTTFLAVAAALLARSSAGAVLIPATPVPQFGTDTQVNPVPTATPATQKNVSVAVSPNNPNLVISGYDNKSGE